MTASPRPYENAATVSCSGVGSRAELTTPMTIGRIRLLAELGAGGNATVYYGLAKGPGAVVREVAVKRMHAHLARDPKFVDLFLDEARLASFVRHANVLSAIDVVEADNELLIVMDYLPGESLSALLKSLAMREERAPLPVVAAIGVSLLQGLHAAHTATDEEDRALEVVHRDVSPQNVIVGADGVSRLIDFGVAKSIGQQHLTETGAIMGKLAYMAPEVVRGDRPSPQSDLFAAAIVLWELVSGRRLFVGDSDAELLLALLEAPISSPSTVRPEAPAPLDEVLLRGLERDPTARFPDAISMAKALEQAVAPASTMAVAEWLQSVAADSLELRRRRLAQARRGATPDDGQADNLQAEDTRAEDTRADDARAKDARAKDAQTERPNKDVVEPVDDKPRRPIVLLVVGTLLALGAIGLVWHRQNTTPPVQRATALPEVDDGPSATAEKRPPSPTTTSSSPPVPPSITASTKTAPSPARRPPPVARPKPLPQPGSNWKE